LYGAETWTLRKVGQKYLQSFEGWCCGMIEKISRTDHVRNGKNVTKSQGGYEYPTYSEKKEGQLDSSDLA
jgi:hypothetical protein